MAIRDIYALGGDRSAEARRRSTEEDGSVTANILTILWRQKLLILATIVLCLGLGLVYIIITPPRYLAATSILIDPRLGKGLGADSTQPGFIPDASAMDSQIKLFTSQTVLSRVAKIAHLKDDPEFNGLGRGALQRLLRPALFLVDGVDLKTLDDAITIKRPERTYVVGIEVLSRDPNKAAEIANAVTQAYIEDQVSSRVDAARTDTNFVRQRLDKLSSQIKDAEDKVETYKVQNNIVDAGGMRSNEQQVLDLSRSLGDARAKTSAAKAKLTEIDAMANRGRLDASSEALTSVTIERLRQQQAETEQTVAKLSTTLGSRHPERLEAEGRQAKIGKLIHDELQRLKLAAAGDYKAALDNEHQIEAQVDRLKGRSATLSRSLVPLDQLERNVRVLRASFDRFAQADDNLSQQQAESPPGRVIAIARPPVSPASPKTAIVGTISLGAGVFFGLAAALFVESAKPARPVTPAPIYDAPPETPAPPPRPRPRRTRRYWDDHDDESLA